MRENIENRRDAHLDALSGVMIVWVIFGHIELLTGIYLLRSRYVPLLFCYMGWFFFKAGMFFRERTIGEEIRAVFKRLLLPYIFFTLLGGVVEIIIECVIGGKPISDNVLRVGRELLINGYVYYTTPVWFLLALSVSRIIFQLFKKNNRIIIFLSFCAAWLLNRYSITEPIYLGNICLGLFFYAVGYSLREIQYNRWLMCVAIVICLISYVVFPASLDFRANRVTSGTYIGYVMSAVFANILLNNLFRMIPVTSGCGWRGVIHVGQHSMPYYLCHWPMIIITIKMIDKFCHFPSFLVLLIVILVCSIGLPILYKVFHSDGLRYFVGE